jgi:hypothetical protein
MAKQKDTGTKGFVGQTNKTSAPKGFVGQSTKKTAKSTKRSSADVGPTSRVTKKFNEDQVFGALAPKSELDAIRKKAAAEAAAAAAAGGGGGGRNVLNDYTRQLQSLLTGGSYGKPYDQLQSQLEGMYGGAQADLTTDRDAQLSGLNSLYGDAQTNLNTRNTQGLTNLQTGYDTARTSLAGLNTQAGKTINSSMDSLEAMLKGQANPYANLQAEAVTPTAQLSSFLQGQNVGDQQTQDYAQVLNAQNAGSAGAFNNLAGILRSISGANQQGALADVAVQRDASTRQLAGNNQAYGNQLTQGLLADKLKMGQAYDQNTFDISKGLLGDTSNVNQNYSQNKQTYNQGLLQGTQSVAQNKTGQQNDLIQQMLAAIAKGGVPKKGKLF